MSSRYAQWVACLLLIVTSWSLAGWYYADLPALTPSYGSSDAGLINLHNAMEVLQSPIFFYPLLLTGMLLWLAVIPAISPRGFRLNQARRSWFYLLFANGLFLLVVQLMAYHTLLDAEFDMKQWLIFVVGGLFLVIGNLLGKFPRNFFTGIRTPWTLASEEVWFRTHRLAGYLFVIAGLLVMLLSVTVIDTYWLFGIILAAALIPAVYSFFLYRRLEGFNNDSD